MANLIVVLQDGQIVEQGSHCALMRRDGLYAELYRFQSQPYRIIDRTDADHATPTTQ